MYYSHPVDPILDKISEKHLHLIDDSEKKEYTEEIVLESNRTPKIETGAAIVIITAPV